MGMLTTITFRNDPEWIRRNPELVAQLIVDAMNGKEVHERIMIAQAPVHSSEHTIYVCAGNTTVNVSHPYEDKVMELSRRVPDFFGEIMGTVKACAHAMGKIWAARKKV